MRVCGKKKYLAQFYVATLDEREALRLANDSRFGLAAAVFTKASDRLHRITKALDQALCGKIARSHAFPNFLGGTKRSGVGRDLGQVGLDAYLEPKQTVWYVSSDPLGWYPAPKL